MGTLSRAAPAAALTVALLAGPASAQHYKWDLGGFGSASWFTPMLGSSETGVTSGTGKNVRFEAGFGGGGEITIWPSQRLGVRLDGYYAGRPLDGGGTLLYGHTNIYMGTVDLMLRFREPNAEWSGMEFLPYVTGGLGARWFQPGAAPYTCSNNASCSPFIVPPTGAVISTFTLEDKLGPAALIGIGTDIRLLRHISLRLEANDRISKPVTYTALFPQGNTVTLPQGEDNVAKLTNELGAQLGLHLLLGMKGAEQVATTPPPLPPPPPAEPPPSPPPPPPPAARDINVCVIASPAQGGLHMVAAQFRPASRDTVVVQGGQTMPLSSTVGNVPVAANADWYLRGQPFAVVAGRYRMEFVTFGGARQVDPSQVTYLGDANGVAVYANTDEAASLAGSLATLRSSRNTNDLGTLLRTQASLRTAFDKLTVLYVPLRPVGCVVQPLQKQEQVRKG